MQSYDILIVDDDIEDHFIMTEYFNDGQYRQKKIKFLLNGREALEYLAAIAQVAELPKLIILDLNMPILNGTETLIELKQSETLSSIPVCIFSTSDNAIQRQKCLNLGAVDYLVKPSSFGEGKKIIEKFASYAK